MEKYYHGSQSGEIKELITSHSKDGYVYVTSSRLVALTYIARSFPNLFFTKNGKEVFWELKKGLFEEMVKDKSGYIYTLEKKDYESIPQNNKCGHQYCMRVKDNVKIVEKEYVENVYEELLKYLGKGEFEIIRYDNIPEEVREKECAKIKEIILTLSKEEQEEYHWKNFI